jgi:hypothetical protein
MQRLGTSLVRIMSYGVDVNDLQEAKRFGKLREICKIFADSGVTVAHETAAITAVWDGTTHCAFWRMCRG